MTSTGSRVACEERIEVTPPVSLPLPRMAFDSHTDLGVMGLPGGSRSDVAFALLGANWPQ